MLEKPQERVEEIGIKAPYSDTVMYYYELIKKSLPELEHENIQNMADAVYKAAYIDGFKDALFFTERYFL